MVFGVFTSDSDIVLALIFPHWLRLNRKTYIKCLEEALLPWVEWVDDRRLYVWQKDSVPYHINRRTQLWPHHSKHLAALLLRLHTPLIIICGAWLNVRHQYSVQHQRWTKGKDNGVIYQLKQGYRPPKGLHEILKLSGGNGWSQWRFPWLNLIKDIFI